MTLKLLNFLRRKLRREPIRLAPPKSYKVNDDMRPGDYIKNHLR